MSTPPPELDRLVRAHRLVHRPDPELRARVRAAVERDARREVGKRWIAGALVGAALGLAAILVVRCAMVSPSGMQAVQSDIDPHGAAYERDDTKSPSSSLPGTPARATGPVAPDADVSSIAPAHPPTPPTTKRPAKPVTRPAADDEREVSLLRQAEVEIRDDPDAALGTLARHEREFPRTSLDVERQALSVLALCAAGRRIEGGGRRATFLKAHPGSAYAARVSAACVDH